MNRISPYLLRKPEARAAVRKRASGAIEAAMALLPLLAMLFAVLETAFAYTAGEALGYIVP